MRYTVTQGFHVGLTGDALEAHLDEVLQALFDVGAEDVDAGGALASGDIEISMTVESESFRAAQEKAADLTRKAIGTAGGTIVDGNGARPVDDQGPSFDLRSVGAERVGT